MADKQLDSPRGSAEVQPADPSARRRAAALTVALAVAGGIAIWCTQRWLAEVRTAAERNPAEAVAALIGVVDWLALGVCLPLIAVSVYGYWLAYRIGSSRRFPPPGLKVVRDTPVVSGVAALTRARLLALLTTLLLAASVALPWMLIRAVSMLGTAVE